MDELYHKPLKITEMKSIERFKEIASEPRFKGWPMVGEPVLGAKIPYFGQVLEYELKTGNGVEKYFSLLRQFGWAVVFGITEKNKIITLVQWKPGVNCASWELPPGGIGKINPNASIEEISLLTRKSFLKETGYGGGEYEYLGHVMIETGKYRGAGPDDHGLPAHMFLATGLHKVQDAREPEKNEIMEILEVPFNEFLGVLRSGLFTEASAVACALKAMYLFN